MIEMSGDGYVVFQHTAARRRLETIGIIKAIL